MWSQAIGEHVEKPGVLPDPHQAGNLPNGFGHGRALRYNLSIWFFPLAGAYHCLPWLPQAGNPMRNYPHAALGCTSRLIASPLAI